MDNRIHDFNDIMDVSNMLCLCSDAGFEDSKSLNALSLVLILNNFLLVPGTIGDSDYLDIILSWI
jgi:hypothetical protein